MAKKFDEPISALEDLAANARRVVDVLAYQVPRIVHKHRDDNVMPGEMAWLEKRVETTADLRDALAEGWLIDPNRP